MVELDSLIAPETLPVFENEDLIGPLKKMQGISHTRSGKYAAWIRGNHKLEIGPLKEDSRRGEKREILLIGIFENPYTASHHRREFLEKHALEIFGEEMPEAVLEQLDTVTIWWNLHQQKFLFHRKFQETNCNHMEHHKHWMINDFKEAWRRIRDVESFRVLFWWETGEARWLHDDGSICSERMLELYMSCTHRWTTRGDKRGHFVCKRAPIALWNLENNNVRARADNQMFLWCCCKAEITHEQKDQTK